MSAGASGKHTVLVVDDNPELLFLVAESLGKLGNFTVVTADNGAEGLERYYQTRPDCVIIDVKMPGLDGYQLVRALRGDPATRATPLIILSALIQERDRLAGLLSGADHYLTKPIAPAELIDVVSRVIAESVEHRQERERRFLAQVADEQREERR
jgi:two-component system, OmpR family, alkaline phosphatase synthesis response regulator PhoP